MSSTTTAAPSSYATLSLHKSDTIRLLAFPDSLLPALEALLLASWPPGLESQSRLGQSYDFKFKGSPFGYYRSQQHVGGIRLLRNVLAFLYEHDWVLVAPVLCSRRYTAKDTLIFRQAGEGQPLPPVEWLGLAPLAKDKLRVVYDAPGVRLAGGTGEGEHDHDHLGVLITGLKKMLQELEYFDKGDWSHDSFEFVLKGTPWRSRGEASVKMRIMLMRLLETMESHGWRLYTTLVQRTGTDEDRILDTWYFVREKEKTREVRFGVV
jgi:hypothetical protein